MVVASSAPSEPDVFRSFRLTNGPVVVAATYSPPAAAWETRSARPYADPWPPPEPDARERAQKLGGRSCSRCGVGLHISARVDARYCSTTCQQADWYDTNGDRLRAAARDWSRRNPDLRLDAHRRRRARKQGAEVGPIDLEVVWLRDEGKCWICGRVVDGKATNPAPLSGSLDHVIPLAAGGAHNMSNVALAHLRCNIQKKDRLLDRIPSWMHRGGDAT